MATCCHFLSHPIAEPACSGDAVDGRPSITSGGWIRTSDLRVMSPTSCQLLYPAIMRCTVCGHARGVKGNDAKGGRSHGATQPRRAG